MNDTIFYFFYNFAHQSNFLDDLIIFFAVYFPYIVVLLAIIFLIFHHEIFSSKSPWKEFVTKWKEFFLVFFSGGLAWVIATVLKILIHTPRPFDALVNVYNLFPETSYAFPSGHATFYSALAIALFFVNKKVGYWFMFFALLIGLARIAGGVHFPIDILGGLVLGALVAYLVKNV